MAYKVKADACDHTAIFHHSTLDQNVNEMQFTYFHAFLANPFVICKPQDHGMCDRNYKVLCDRHK